MLRGRQATGVRPATLRIQKGSRYGPVELNVINTIIAIASTISPISNAANA